MASETPPAAKTPILFRPSKKRKIYRSRAPDDHDVSEEETPSTSRPATAAPQSLDELIASTGEHGASAWEVGTGDLPMAEILRLRKQQRRGKFGGGVEFKAEGANRSIMRGGDGEDVMTNMNTGEEEGSASITTGPRKFAPQTGTVGGDVDRHMVAYIDSQLAKRQMEALQLTAKPSTASSASTGFDGGPVQAGGGASAVDSSGRILDVQRQPAALGKLMEIDLGEEARHRNVERTTQATRRLNGEEIEEGNKLSGKPTKVRLGRDGKPWRGRKRRGSDDVKRDKLVEEVLRENRLEIYDEPQEDESNNADDQAADDRIAEAFRKEFMDAVSARQRKRANPAPPPSRTAAGKKEEEVLKGPKLGGSRSARAAMRETMLKNAKK